MPKQRRFTSPPLDIYDIKLPSRDRLAEPRKTTDSGSPAPISHLHPLNEVRWQNFTTDTAIIGTLVGNAEWSLNPPSEYQSRKDYKPALSKTVIAFALAGTLVTSQCEAYEAKTVIPGIRAMEPDLNETGQWSITPAWFGESMEQIASLESLPFDWNGNGASAPNEIAMQSAHSVLAELIECDFMKPHISPSAEDGIGVAFRRGDLYGDIECFNSGEIVAVITDGHSRPEVWEVDDDAENIRLAIKKIQQHVQQ